jgi:hypothetical protein
MTPTRWGALLILVFSLANIAFAVVAAFTRWTWVNHANVFAAGFSLGYACSLLQAEHISRKAP